MLRRNKRQKILKPRSGSKPGRRNQSNPSLQLAKSGCFVPSRTRVSLRAAISYNAAASASYTQLSLSGNSAFDPMASTGTIQPVGFDYWASMYERYRVIGSRCHLVTTLVGTGTGGGIGGAASLSVALYPSNATGSLATFSDAIAQPLAKNSDATHAQRSVLQSTISTSKMSGNKSVEGSDQFQATIGASPANEWFWNIGFICGAAYTSTDVNIDMVTTYDVEFFDRAQINRSSLVAGYIRKAYLAHCAELQQRLQDAQKRRGAFPQPESKEDSKSGYVHVDDVEDLIVPTLIRGPSPLVAKMLRNTAPVCSAQGAVPPQTPAKGFFK